MKPYLTGVAFLAAFIALQAAAQQADPAGALPPGGEAPVDEVPAISDAAPQSDGTPDATSVTLSCSFATECVDDECAATDYEGRLTIISDGAGLAEAEWDDPSESVAMAAVVENGMTLASATETAPAKQRLLTVLESGEARFTTHLTDPAMSITYAGQCE
ncbi:hypothetical protein [Paracoccus aerodenitrificans]|uniref:hypothetical protein n=1 Tax=Paracoccus aerodenitrificans TaxID=3017781 RepID=UPI0022F05277|nr:hypothetical protein [Paracoccus aerodenitrificans]WBU65036.1 hypothetical protein PAE61_06290 [Paracoccus aerodenitrificans]